MYPALETIVEYRQDTRNCLELPDIGFAHECIDALLDELAGEKQRAADLAEQLQEATDECKALDEQLHGLRVQLRRFKGPVA